MMNKSGRNLQSRGEDDFGTSQQGFGKTGFNQTQGSLGTTNPASLKGKLMSLEVRMQ